MKITELKAKEIVNQFQQEKDLARFIERVSDACQYYGRFSYIPRANFTQALLAELLNIKARVRFGDEREEK